MQQRPEPRGAFRPAGWRRALARALGAAAVLLLAALGGPLVAAPPAAAAGPNAVTLTMDGAKPFTVRAETEPDLVTALLNEVQWMASGPGRANGTEKSKLGPKVNLTVLVNDVPKQSFDLYPLAAGGPRGCRRAKQPGRWGNADAWFLARLTLPDTLRTAGVPLTGGPQLFSAGGGDGSTGGSGGGTVAQSTEQDNGPSFTRVGDFAEVLGAWRQVLLLNGAVVLIIAGGLAGISWLIRRKV